MKKPPINGKVISGVKINKKAKQKGGLAAFDYSRRFPSNKTPKIYIGLSKQYLRLQNEYVEDTIKDVVEISNKKDFIENITSYLSHRKCISFWFQEEGRVSFSAWVQGPPSYSLYSDNYDIDNEEKTALSLVTMTIEDRDGQAYYEIHHNGVVISIHGIARLIQRMGYESEHLSIKREIDQIIPWATLKSSLIANGLKHMKQLLTPSNHGMWFGSLALVPDRNREGKPSFVYFVRTFVSEGILEDNQIERLETIREEDTTQGEVINQATREFLIRGITPVDEVALPSLIQIMEAKDDFFSEDKFIDRVMDTLDKQEYAKPEVIDVNEFKHISEYREYEYRPVERANI